jgi:hypothetical protein
MWASPVVGRVVAAKRYALGRVMGVSSITRAPGCGILGSVHRRAGWVDPSWRVQRKVSLADRYLVEWVAQAKIGDQFPEPWRWASNPIESIIRTLVELGVIDKPGPDIDLAAVAQQASEAARVWLEANPQAPPDGQPGKATGRGLK